MPPEIVLFSPSKGISERARIVSEELSLEIDLVIHETVGEEAVAVALEAERHEADVMVARGINCSIIQSAVQTPVVEIVVTGQDLATALHDAKKYTKLEHPRIALLAFTSVQHHVEVLANLLDIDLRVYPVANDLDFIRSQILRAKADGAHIAVAGTITGNMARESGLPALLLDSGELALSSALLEAQRLTHARRLENLRAKRLQAAVNVSHNGVLVLDSQGIVQAINTEARRILCQGGGSEGRKATEMLPPTLLERCRQNESVVDELLEINGTQLLLNATTVTEGTAVSDIIFTLQPVAAISELESKLRKSLHARGLICQYSFGDILGTSDALRRTVVTAHSFAHTDSPVFLTGETGAGKELFAQAIHQASPFASGPFVPINCAALPPSLLESELFGHEEGAFTGARRNGKAGFFEMAHGGTIFLDEISEMNHYGQTRLLRVLQERSTMRIGGDKYIPVTARVIAASNRDLPEMVRRGRFRQDLYYRLNILPLHIPPLREREGDIAFLAGKFVEQFCKKYGATIRLTPEMIALLEGHPWPGNVRELSTVIERLTLLGRAGPVGAEHLKNALDPEKLCTAMPPVAARPDCPERQRIIKALSSHSGHIGNAAAALGIHRTTLQRKIRALNIALHRQVM